MGESDKDRSFAIVDELLHELSECREDERNSQNQLLQVIAAAGTILGICFAFLNPSSENSVMDVNHYHLVLGLISCVLSTAFPYITFLGIGNVMRYHHIQNLEDRLTTEVYGNNRKNAVLHWMSLSSPVLTKNVAHLKSIYSYVAYITYAAATVSAVFFGVMTIHFVSKQIKNPVWTDCLFICIPAVSISFSLFTFILISIYAKKMYRWAHKTAWDKREMRFMNRKNEEKVLTCQEIAQVVLYFLYPKKKDIQKMLLIPMGSIVGLFYQYETISWEIFSGSIKNILITILVIDFLVYQSRYQWNDIRGIDEDLKAEKKGRLPVKILGVKRAVFLSFLFIIAKYIVAIYISIFSENSWLLFCVLGISIISILYEFVRYIENNKMIFLLVGMGYFLRFYSGLYTILQQNESIWCCLGNIQFFPLYIGYIAFGCYSAILPWTHEAVAEYKKGIQRFKLKVRNINPLLSEETITFDIETLTFSKGYLFILFDKIKPRLYRCSRDGNYIFPLKESGSFFDPWNISFFLSVLALCVGILLMNTYFLVKVLGTLSVILIIPIEMASSKNIGKRCVLIIMLIICEILFSNSPLLSIYCVHQLLFLAAYCFLRFYFNPEYDCLKEVFRLIVGNRTFERLEAQQCSSKPPIK